MDKFRKNRNVMLARWATEGEVLANLIDAKYESRAEFAKLMNVSDDVVSHLCRGITALRGDRRKKAAHLLGVPEDLLKAHRKPGSTATHLGHVREPEPFSEPASQPVYTNMGKRIPVAPTGCRIVPVYGGVPAGEPGRSYSDAIDFVEMPEWGGDFLRWGRFVEGDSMEPEFRHGDIVIFENRGVLPRNAVHAMKEGEDAFKVLIEKRKGEGELWPTNDKHTPFSADGWSILGVAIRRIRREGLGADMVEDERKYPNGYRWLEAVP